MISHIVESVGRSNLDWISYCSHRTKVLTFGFESMEEQRRKSKVPHWTYVNGRLNKRLGVGRIKRIKEIEKEVVEL